MKNGILFCAVLGLASVTATAQDSGTPALILKDLFNRAQPAEMSDYPRISDLKTDRVEYRCITSDKSSLKILYIGRYFEMIPGEPGAGPLFPGKWPTTPPEIGAEKLSIMITSLHGFALSSEHVTQIMKNEGLKAETLRTSEGELETHAIGAKKSVVVTYRKLDDMLSFRQVHSERNKVTKEAYGYCFKID